MDRVKSRVKSIEKEMYGKFNKPSKEFLPNEKQNQPRKRRKPKKPKKKKTEIPTLEIELSQKEGAPPEIPDPSLLDTIVRQKLKNR